jgi:hypothetical protein
MGGKLSYCSLPSRVYGSHDNRTYPPLREHYTLSTVAGISFFGVNPCIVIRFLREMVTYLGCFSATSSRMNLFGPFRSMSGQGLRLSLPCRFVESVVHLFFFAVGICNSRAIFTSRSVEYILSFNERQCIIHCLAISSRHVRRLCVPLAHGMGGLGIDSPPQLNSFLSQGFRTPPCRSPEPPQPTSAITMSERKPVTSETFVTDGCSIRGSCAPRSVTDGSWHFIRWSDRPVR